MIAATEKQLVACPANVALEIAVYLITATTGVDGGPHIYALGQASVSRCERWCWTDLTTIINGVEAKLGNAVAVAALEHARRMVSR